MRNNTSRTYACLPAGRCLPLFSAIGRIRRGGLEGILIFLLMIPSSFAAVTPEIQTYDQLLSAIREVRSASEQRMENERVRVAWETGKLIDTHVLQHKARADYGKKTLERLSADLETSTTELSYMLKFFRNYPILPPAEELSWSRYREILSLDDQKAREEVTNEAVRENWSRAQVRKEVRRRNTGSKNEEKLPVSAPGNLFTYRVVKSAVEPYAGRLALDLGFAVKFCPESLSLAAFKAGDFVEFRDGKLIQSKNAPAGTYQAYVTEIIDGDTVHARIDLGFGLTIEQKLRLRGIDAPVLESSDGREAKEFLEKNLPGRGTPILITTTKNDKYDRYLADIWVDGTFINQKLIDEGFAVMVEE